MPSRLIQACAVLVAGVTAWWAAGPACGPAAAGTAGRPATRPTGVAVVELFTSQGCSSCPPAEAVVGDLARAAAGDGRPVYALAFHVDYWNRLGWADPFSDPAFSRRQSEYSRAFGLDEVYTPQMVVNGRAQFVGSDRAAADRAVADALESPAPARVTVTATVAGKGGWRVRPVVDGAPADAVVNVAVVERDLSTDVRAGENRGRRLDQPRVVRWFATVPAAGAGEVVVPPLPAVRPGHASVVAFAQRPGCGPVLGAAAVDLP